ncbi:hypothetical protein [Kribbella sp. VKM Ac-2568]|uniref:hypothetical protein n=1 Tax=Kribbella sp. VKM Ac-2568 TaxID=2512219 RepID=UPI0010429D68|nr:hypothetical protein [Kribbella sp. VKM Ac-2568]TCM42498.1 hypothetical protein EV648_11028 [Kribbella sp. VKM Ac-2568]
MDAEAWIALTAVLLSLFSIALHLVLRAHDRREERQTSVISALQGEREALSFEAHRITTRGWPKRSEERGQVRDALCLAFIFETSDRSRALVYEALKKASDEDRAELVLLLNRLIRIFRDLERQPEWDLHRAWPKIAILGQALDDAAITEHARKYLQNGIDTRRAAKQDS